MSLKLPEKWKTKVLLLLIMGRFGVIIKKGFHEPNTYLSAFWLEEQSLPPTDDFVI